MRQKTDPFSSAHRLAAEYPGEVGIALLESQYDAILVVMEQWSPEQRVFVIEAYFKSGDSTIATQRQFRAHFDLGRHGNVPSRKTITRWVTNLRTTGSALKKNPTGRTRSVRTPENIDRDRVAVENNPRRAARKQARICLIAR